MQMPFFSLSLNLAVIIFSVWLSKIAQAQNEIYEGDSYLKKSG
jgi:hypothetical protein